MPQQIQPYPQQETMDHSKSEPLEVSPITVPSMSPITDIPFYYGGYYLHYYQTMPRPLMPTPIHHTLENATISFDTLMDSQVKWHKDLLVKDVFLSPPMLSNHPHPSSTTTTTTTTTTTMKHHLMLPSSNNNNNLKKMEMAPSDLLFINNHHDDVFGLNDDNTCILLDQQQHQQQQSQQKHHRIYDDLPTPPATNDHDDDHHHYLGMKRRHSSICSSDSSSDDGSSVQSDSEKRPCLVHSPCSLPESPTQLPMFDFDDDEDDDDSIKDQRTLTSTDFQPYPTILESMTDDEDDMTLHETKPLEFKTNQNPLFITTKPNNNNNNKKASSSTLNNKKYNMKKQLKEKINNKSTNALKSTTKLNKKQQQQQQQLMDDSNQDNNNNVLPTYVPHGSPEVAIRYSSQGLYKHLLKQRVDWCRYCGTTEGVNWRPGPWGKRTLCNKHGCDYKGYGFACKLPRLDLTAFLKETMDQRIRPVLQLFCTVCHRPESWEDNLLVQCDGCPMAYHQQCRKEQDLSDDFCQSNQPFFCTDHVCKENLEKKRVVVEFSRKRLPLMRTPKQQQQQQQANLINNNNNL